MRERAGLCAGGVLQRSRKYHRGLRGAGHAAACTKIPSEALLLIGPLFRACCINVLNLSDHVTNTRRALREAGGWRFGGWRKHKVSSQSRPLTP
ncbi:hypothetical protein SKAU_G00041560 [Synaphobranchus kaupii]|uniref:Uncharacterized protein n=1 Tax=Synaphobranchus kaupii TaxID=118154 RepID=A0A9Q1J7S8_SYNKA|nr:hypothetical protein SKAU_G00041560 [Synaphobranchus kaupii]